MLVFIRMSVLGFQSNENIVEIRRDLFFPQVTSDLLCDSTEEFVFTESQNVSALSSINLGANFEELKNLLNANLTFQVIIIDSLNVLEKLLMQNREKKVFSFFFCYFS